VEAEVEGTLLKANHLIAALHSQMEAVLNRLQIHAGEAGLVQICPRAAASQVQIHRCFAT
jgi:hypothetical protein